MGYSNSEFHGDKDNGVSTLGYVMNLGNICLLDVKKTISFQQIRQHTHNMR